MSNKSEIQQLCEKLEKLTGKKVVFTEGIWALSKDPAVFQEAKRELETYKDKYYHLIGDDDMFDGIDTAIRRIEELEQHISSTKNS